MKEVYMIQVKHPDESWENHSYEVYTDSDLAHQIMNTMTIFYSKDNVRIITLRVISSSSPKAA